MPIFTYEIVKMRFNLETKNLICAFPLLETRTTTINRTGKQEKRLMKMPQGLKNRNLIFQKQNVCGIKSKLVLLKFIQLITTHDIQYVFL
jgi:hypothetical protein